MCTSLSQRFPPTVFSAVADYVDKGKDAAKQELDNQIDKNLDDKQKAQLEQAKSIFGK